MDVQITESHISSHWNEFSSSLFIRTQLLGRPGYWDLTSLIFHLHCPLAPRWRIGPKNTVEDRLIFTLKKKKVCSYEIAATWSENFPMWSPSPNNRHETLFFNKISSLSRQSGQTGIIFALNCLYSHFTSVRKSGESTKLRFRERYISIWRWTFWFNLFFLFLILVDRAEKYARCTVSKNRPDNQPAKFQDSNEEAL